MTNADKFKQIFGIYATELWVMPEEDFLAWLNAEAKTEDWIPCSERLPNNDTIKCPEDKTTYAVICKKFPNPNVYFESYELAKRWVKLEQPNNRPFYIVKRTEHFELCNNCVESVEALQS